MSTDPKHIAGIDAVSRHAAGSGEALRKAQFRNHSGGPGDAVIDGDDKSIALPHDAAFKDFVLGRTGARQTTPGQGGGTNGQYQQPGPAQKYHAYSPGLLTDWFWSVAL